ncbi:MAG: nickel-dependent hydrogenase large subunit, partial [Planctomycetes bacterium]|nr:nickel-dependent hydrogenase large subunit [Planctomycetota bacterium]
QCENLLNRFKKWYEQRVLGCSVERFLEVRSSTDLDAWLEQQASHNDGELGFFIRFGRMIGLDKIGRGHDHFLSFGQLDLPPDSEVRGWGGSKDLLFPAGFVRGASCENFTHTKVAEHVSHSWFEPYEGGLHPFEGKTVPYATGNEGRRYTWAKAPRYDGYPAEVGPLAELLVARIPLFTDLVGQGGTNSLVREMARLVRPAFLLPAMESWLARMDPKASYYCSVDKITEGEGYGITEASRGALGHWVQIEEGRIRRYQIITPTAWNGSPRDTDGVRGPWEEALIGTRVKDPENPIELGHVVRSFDPCLVCTVHTLHRSKSKVRLTV